MAVTITELDAGAVGIAAGVDVRMLGTSRKPKIKAFKVAFDASYPTGGENISTGLAGFADVRFMIAEQLSNRVVVASVPANGAPASVKLLLYTALGTEAANASDQSAIVAWVICGGY